MTPPPSEIARIAKGLTKAQREVMLSSIHDPARHGPYHIYRPRANSLQSVLAMARQGMIARYDDDTAYEFFERRASALGGMMILTPLGISVRKYLEGGEE